MGEFELIASVFAPLSKDFDGSLGLRDDAALLRVAQGQELVITTDSVQEGVHFLGGEDAALIAKKLLRRNLSDLAAMGAEPLCYLLTLMLPKTQTRGWVEHFAQGLAEDQALYGITLAGGDTSVSRGELFAASVTAMGTVTVGTALRRSGAKVGDWIFVSGTLGDSTLGLALLQERLKVALSSADSLWLKECYFLPQPRVQLGQKLVGCAHAVIDISDGLLQDLGHVCAASGVGAVLHRRQLPLSSAARAVVEAQPDWWEAVLSGGDDYELLFTAPEREKDRIAGIAAALNLTISPIGKIVRGEGVQVLDEHGIDATPVIPGFTHRL